MVSKQRAEASLGLLLLHALSQLLDAGHTVQYHAFSVTKQHTQDPFGLQVCQINSASHQVSQETIWGC